MVVYANEVETKEKKIIYNVHICFVIQKVHDVLHASFSVLHGLPVCGNSWTSCASQRIAQPLLIPTWRLEETNTLHLPNLTSSLHRLMQQTMHLTQ